MRLMNLASHWRLDPNVIYLNHGSFGACPSTVLAEQSALRLEMESEPVDFLSGSLPGRLNVAREALSTFLGADPADLVFVPNATAGVNAVLRSLEFKPEDELLITNHTYAACRKTVDFVAARTGARVVVANLPFPCRQDEQIIEAVMRQVSPRTRLALMDHVTSPTALILPLARLIGEMRARGIDTLVDGAHAPGMLPIGLSELGAAYYTGMRISGFARRRARRSFMCAAIGRRRCIRRSSAMATLRDFRRSSTGQVLSIPPPGFAFRRRCASWPVCCLEAGRK
jgi:isopenicillin-N epimerase